MQRSINAIRFKQWIKEWNHLRFEESELRRRPSEFIYLFAMSANELRSLSGVFRRQRDGADATGVQRGHDKRRTAKIKDYVQYGYPYSDLSPAKRESFDSADLRKPGWLPTAIVVNILTEKDKRRRRKVSAGDLVVVDENQNSNRASIRLPPGFNDEWKPNLLPPIEIIDGQHRLFAFDDGELPGDFELPVVAFWGLDIGWQAYLFWSINVSPKKINPSHAFDLYPLLRSQDWLEKFSESNVYREARAQELTEILFRHAESPWRGRINMLGEKGVGGVTQAAWIRALMATFLAAGRGKGTKGLFGCVVSDEIGPLPWSRGQQSALLIYLWRSIQSALKSSSGSWSASLRNVEPRKFGPEQGRSGDAALNGPYSMLNQDQGVRSLLSVANDLLFEGASELALVEWDVSESADATTDDEDISKLIKSVAKQPVAEFLTEFADGVAEFDWRSANAPNLSDNEKLKRMAFRGSGGYTALANEFLKTLSRRSGAIKKLSSAVLSRR